MSPYLRAQQTATVLFTELKTKHREDCDAITPDGHAAAVVSWLAAEETHGYESVVLVSHMPLVSYLVHSLMPVYNHLFSQRQALRLLNFRQKP